MESNTGVKMAVLFALIGVGMLAWAYSFYRTENHLALSGEPAVGTVVDFREVKGERRATGSRGDDPSNFYWYQAPIVRFRSADGQSVMLSPAYGSYAEGLKKGDALEVVYLPSDPTTAEVKGSTHLSDAAIVLTIFGCAALLPGSFMIPPAILRWRRGAVAARYRRKGRAGK
jgi:hypothetical protein